MSPVLHHRLWCTECHAFLGKHVAISFEERSAYGGLELAPGMVALGNRTYGPSGRPRVRPRRDVPGLVLKRGPVTLHCRQTARFAPVTRATIRARGLEGAEQYADVVLVNIGRTEEAGTSGSMSQRR